MMRIARSIVTCALVGIIAGCTSVPRDATGGARLSDSRLDTLASRGSHQEVLDLVEDRLPKARNGRERAELLYAQGRAQLALQRRHSARISFHRALDALGDDRDPLARTILRGWGDAEFALGNTKDAAHAYGRGFESAARGTAEADELAWSAWYVLDRAGSPEAAAWKRKILHAGARSLSTRERELAALSRTPVRTTTPSRPAVAGAIPSDPHAVLPLVHARNEWHAAAIAGDFKTMEKPWRITVHHGATLFTSSSNAAVSSELRDLQRFHQKDRGWADLGYHFLIDPAGRVWEGRSLRYQGAHAGDSELNRGNIGICLLGNFSAQPLMPVQQQALEDTLRRLQSWFGVPTARVYTHGEIRPTATECPGTALQRWVSDYRARSAPMVARQ